MRVAFAGFQHETNTFGPGQAGMAEFLMADSWPPLLMGAEVETGTLGMNLPIAGALKAGREAGIEAIPILWASAEPSGPVTDEAFEEITGRILDRLREAGPLDGVCLDLHGAMVTDRLEDGEGEVLARVRQLVGPDVPVCASLDLHANVTAKMVENATTLSIFRTYPHLDMAETGARAFHALQRAIEDGPPAKAFRQAPFLVALPAQYTGEGPCKAAYEAAAAITPPEVVEIALGFTAADIHDCGPAFVAYAPTEARAAALADDALARFVADEPNFGADLLSPDVAIRTALAEPGPVVIADVQDNPGAGGSSDTTGLLRAAVAAGARGALFGVFHDPALAAMALEAGVGAMIEGALGGRCPGIDDAPFEGAFRVGALCDGRIAFTGEMYGGAVAELGPTCLLELAVGGAAAQIVVSSVRSQCLDRALFTALGADPARAKIVCVKSTVHFRADFAPIASRILTAAAPGAFPCDLGAIEYRRLRHGVRR